MNPQKRIVYVSASFEQQQGLFRWLQRYGQYFDDRYVYFDEFAFTSFPHKECDAVLVFNTPSEPISTNCYPEQVLAFMMEPGIRDRHPWMFNDLLQYGRVYSHLPQSVNTIISHGYLGWYLPEDLPTLAKMPISGKTKDISCIASGLKQLEGHRLRLGFVNMLKKVMPGIDFFGKGSNYLPDKKDGLEPYRYSIAIENAALPFYFTEKINDCFLAWTIPIYFGCLNIGKYFPGRSFIRIDIRDPRKAVQKIRDVLENDDWNTRLDALREARELVLRHYQPLAGAAAIIRNIPPTSKQQINLHPVNRSWKNKMMHSINRIIKTGG